MKFTDLDATAAREKTIRIDFDGFDLKIGDKTVSLKDQWVEVYPTESKTFRDAKTELSRKAITGDKFDTESLVSALIADWSFDDECNDENKLNAVKIWPQILIDHIDKVASSAVNFTKRKAKNSESTTEEKSG